HFAEVAKEMNKVGVPVPQVMLAGAIVFLIVGGVCVVTGYKARVGAALLFIFLILATYYFHDFWNMPPAYIENQVAHSLKNLGLGGAMLFTIANGPGAWSVDQCLKVKLPPQPQSD